MFKESHFSGVPFKTCTQPGRFVSPGLRLFRAGSREWTVWTTKTVSMLLDPLPGVQNMFAPSPFHPPGASKNCLKRWVTTPQKYGAPLPFDFFNGQFGPGASWLPFNRFRCPWFPPPVEPVSRNRGPWASPARGCRAPKAGHSAPARSSRAQRSRSPVWQDSLAQKTWK